MKRHSYATRTWVTGLTLAALSLAGSVGFAAPSGPTEIVPSDLLVSDWKVGPFYLKPGLAVRDLGYDSNLFLNEEAESDSTLVIAPSLRVALPLGDHLISVRQEFAYHWFNTFEDQNDWSSDTLIKMELLFGPLDLDVTERFRRTREIYSEELFSRPLRLENEFRLVATSDREGGFYLEGMFSHHALRIDEEEVLDPGSGGGSTAETLDRDLARGSLGLFLNFVGETSLPIGGRISQYDYKFGGPERDATEFFAYSGLRGEKLGSWQGDILLGYYALEIADVRHDGFNGFGADVDVNLDMGGATAIGIDIRHGINRSDFSSNLFAVRTYLSGYLRVPLGDRLEFTLTPARGDYSYPQSPLEEAGADFSGEHQVTSFTVGTRVLFSVETSVLVNFIYRNLSGDDFGYDQFAISTGFTYGD